MSRYVLIVAGGSGTRMGGPVPKQFLPLAGRPVLMHTLQRFHDADPAAEIILVLPSGAETDWQPAISTRPASAAPSASPSSARASR